jgi:hypothetical protein
MSLYFSITNILDFYFGLKTSIAFPTFSFSSRNFFIGTQKSNKASVLTLWYLSIDA